MRFGSGVENGTSAIKYPIPRHLKNKIRSLWEHRSFRFLRDYYSGLGSALLYHRIVPQKFQTDEFSPYRGLAVTKECFEEQARYLKENFKCLSLSKAIELLREGTLPRKSLIITFDDGYKDNLTLALPILEKYELPATIYVVTGLIDRTAELWWFEQEFIVRNCRDLDFRWQDKLYRWALGSTQEKYLAIQCLNDLFKKFSLSQQKSFMQALRAQCAQKYSYENEILTWEELEKLDRHPLITIGAHTQNHPMLPHLDKSELLAELSESKASLEKHLGHQISHLAYPFGGAHQVGKREFEVASKCGFVSAVTTRHSHLYEQHHEYLHSLPRISVNYDDSLDALAWKMNGMSSMLHQRGRRIVAG